MNKITHAGPSLPPRPRKSAPERPAISTEDMERGRRALIALGLQSMATVPPCAPIPPPTAQVHKPLTPAEGRAMVAEIQKSYTGRRRLAHWLHSHPVSARHQAACNSRAELAGSYARPAARTLSDDALRVEVQNVRRELKQLDEAINSLKDNELKTRASERLHAASMRSGGDLDPGLMRNASYFSLQILRSNPKLAEASTACLRAQEACFSAATGEPQLSLWQAPLEPVNPLLMGELAKRPPPRWKNPREIVEQMELTRIPLTHARNLASYFRQAAAQIGKEEEFNVLIIQVEQLNLRCKQSTPSHSCKIVNPSDHVLPSTLSERALAGLEAALPTQAVWTPRERELVESLSALAEQAANLDRISRAEGTLWLQVESLLEHEPEIVCMARAVRAQVAELQARHFDRAEELARRAVPTKPKGKKIRKAPAEASLSAPIPPSEPHLADANSWVQAAREACQLEAIADPESEPAAAVEPTWQRVESTHRTPRPVTLSEGVTLLSALGTSALQHLLTSKVDPSTFARRGTPQWLGAARSLVYHMGKHAAPGATAEDYLKQAMAAYEPNLAQMQARSDRLLGHVMVVRTPQHYAVFSKKGQFITYCDRTVCGEHHYPSDVQSDGR